MSFKKAQGPTYGFGPLTLQNIYIYTQKKNHIMLNYLIHTYIHTYIHIYIYIYIGKEI